MEALYDEAVVERDDLRFTEFEHDGAGTLAQVGLIGTVFCCSGALVKVTKWMGVRRLRRREFEVRTDYYQYHAWLPKSRQKRQLPLLRYDHAHGSEPHRHEFDANGNCSDVRQLTLDTIPRLDDVLREAAELCAERSAS